MSQVSSGVKYIENNALTEAKVKENQENMIIPKEFGVHYKKNEPQEVFPFKDKEDIQKIKDYFLRQKQYRNYMLFVFGINLGLRCGDLLSLTWDKILDSDGSVVNSFTVREEKTKKFRTLYLNNSIITAIQLYISNTECLSSLAGKGYVFSSQKKSNECKLEVRSVNHILKTAAEAVGIEFNVGTHSMRKTWGYWQYVTHIDSDPQFIFRLQEMLNHSSQEITLRYIGMSRERDEKYYNDIEL